MVRVYKGTVLLRLIHISVSHFPARILETDTRICTSPMIKYRVCKNNRNHILEQHEGIKTKISKAFLDGLALCYMIVTILFAHVTVQESCTFDWALSCVRPCSSCWFWSVVRFSWWNTGMLDERPMLSEFGCCCSIPCCVNWE